MTIVCWNSHFGNISLIHVYRWKDPKNVYRTEWKVNNTPALLRFEKTGEGVKEVGRLIEGEILDRERLERFLDGELK